MRPKHGDVRRWNLTFQEIVIFVLQKMAPIAFTRERLLVVSGPLNKVAIADFLVELKSPQQRVFI